MPSCLFPEILCLILAGKYQRILVQDVTSKPVKYPLSCPYKHNKKIFVKDVTSEPGKYPLSYPYKHNKRIFVQSVTSEPGNILYHVFINILRWPPNSANISSY